MAHMMLAKMSEISQDWYQDGPRQARKVPGFTLPDAVTPYSHSHVADSKDNAGNHQQHAVPRFDRVGQGVGKPFVSTTYTWTVANLSIVRLSTWPGIRLLRYVVYRSISVYTWWLDDFCL